MAAQELSLDDIIKQKKFKTKQTTRPNVKGVGVGAGAGRGRPMMNRGTLHQVRGDARNKIIQNKRLKIRDARDRLAEIAKQGDARDKLNMKRQFNNNNNNNNNNKFNKKTPGTFVRKVPKLMDKNLEIENTPSYLGGQTRMQGSQLIRTVGHNGVGKSDVIIKGKSPGINTARGMNMGRGMMNLARGIQRQVPGARPNMARRDTDRYHPIPNNPHVVTIKNDKAMFNAPYNRPAVQREAPMKVSRTGPFRSSGAGAMRAAMGIGGGMRSDNMVRPGEHYLYRQEMDEVRPTRLKITTSNTVREPSPQYSDEWDSPSRPAPRPALAPPRPAPPRLPVARAPPKKRSMYEDEDMEFVSRPKKVAPLSSELMARLDQQPQRPAPPRGFKVLVTNLHPCVSVEDMEELFSTIGEITSARIVREGIAEAVFLNEEDAYRSVDVFNNRQLDGQPMSVTVVNKKAPPGSAPPQPTQQARSTTKSVLKAASGSTLLAGTRSSVALPGLQASKRHERVAPDAGAIRHALFRRSHPAATTLARATRTK